NRARSDLKHATREHLRDYLAALANITKASTQSRKLSALKGFYGFLYSEGLRGDDPTAAISAPKINRPLPKILSAHEAERLIETARLPKKESEKQDPDALRLTCMVEMLYASGLRVTELIALPLASVRNRERFLHIRGKGGRERLAPMGAQAKQALDAY